MNEKSAFYLKYRPQSLSELIGQESVKAVLSKVISENKLSHAYLFVGPRGTGKTSSARILAKMVNCESKEEVPCNKCAACVSIIDGSNLDLIEIDAASNRGIEDIRSLRQNIKLAPTSAKKKVYIIDEVHMLTQEAFNALLKTLEEPPAHALFILATTEISKVPQTILSRCMRLNFTLAQPDQLKQALEKIIKAEKIDIEDEAVEVLVKKADGSFRDAVKLLDQLSRKGKISKKEVLENFHILDFENIVAMLERFKDKDSSASLLEVQKLISSGVDIKELTLSLMDVLREMMFIKTGLGEVIVKSHYTLDKYERLDNLCKKFEMTDLTASLNILQKAIEQLKFASIPSMPLELAVVEICGFSPVLEKKVKQPAEETIAAEVPQPSLPVTKEQEVIDTVVYASPQSVQSDTPTFDDSSPDISKLKEKWTYILETSRSYNFSLEALLRSVRISQCTDVLVVMEVPYSFHQRILEAPKNRDFLEGVISEVLGRSIKVSCILGNRPVKKEDIENIEVAQDDEIIRVAAEIFNSDSVN